MGLRAHALSNHLQKCLHIVSNGFDIAIYQEI